MDRVTLERPMKYSPHRDSIATDDVGSFDSGLIRERPPRAKGTPTPGGGGISGNWVREPPGRLFSVVGKCAGRLDTIY